MQISFNNRNDRDYEKMLNDLLKNTFLDFQFWYDLNLWDENYESYSFVENGKVISNICVYKTQLLFEQKKYPALSLGAVTTKKEYRGRGLSRMLMEHIIEKYDGVLMYLSTNDSVVNFYLKFGFERVFEKLPVGDFKIDNKIKTNKLKYNSPKVWDYVFKRINYSTKLDCLNTASINIFHIYWGYLKDCIYELPELDTMIVAKQKGTTLKLYGVFSLKDINFSELISVLPFCDVKRIEFGFMPDWPDVNFIMEEYETDPLFVRGLTRNLGDFKFPELSVT